MKGRRKQYLPFFPWALYLLLEIAQPAQPKKDAVVRTFTDRDRAPSLALEGMRGPNPIGETPEEPQTVKEPSGDAEGPCARFAQSLQPVAKEIQAGLVRLREVAKGIQAGLVRTREVASAIGSWVMLNLRLSGGWLSGKLRLALWKDHRIATGTGCTTAPGTGRTAAPKYTAATLPPELVEHLQRELSSRTHHERTSTGKCSGRGTRSTEGSTLSTAGSTAYTAAADSSSSGPVGPANTPAGRQDGSASGLGLGRALRGSLPDPRTVPWGPSSRSIFRSLLEYGELPPSCTAS